MPTQTAFFHPPMMSMFAHFACLTTLTYDDFCTRQFWNLMPFPIFLLFKVLLCSHEFSDVHLGTQKHAQTQYMSTPVDISTAFVRNLTNKQSFKMNTKLIGQQLHAKLSINPLIILQMNAGQPLKYRMMMMHQLGCHVSPDNKAIKCKNSVTFFHWLGNCKL